MRSREPVPERLSRLLDRLHDVAHKPQRGELTLDVLLAISQGDQGEVRLRTAGVAFARREHLIDAHQVEADLPQQYDDAKPAGEFGVGARIREAGPKGWDEPRPPEGL